MFLRRPRHRPALLPARRLLGPTIVPTLLSAAYSGKTPIVSPKNRPSLLSQRQAGIYVTQGERKLGTSYGESHVASDRGFELPVLTPRIPGSPGHIPLTFDTAEILNLPYPEAPETQRRMRISPATGLTGDMDEVWPVFDACLRVGKLDRASQFIDRLQSCHQKNRRDHHTLTIEQLVALHERYICARVQELIVDFHPDVCIALQDWYETRFRAPGFVPTPPIVASMLKVSLLQSKNSIALSSNISRYMENADEITRFEALGIAEILTPLDVATITQTEPKLYGLETGLKVEEIPSITSETKDMPQVTSSIQKGQGLKSLKKSLELFNKIPEGSDWTSLSSDEMREIQSRLEQDALESAISRWRTIHADNIKNGHVDPSVVFGTQLHSWHLELESLLQKEFRDIDLVEAEGPTTPDDMDRCLYGPLIQMSTPERLAAATIISTLNTLSAFGLENGLTVSIAVRSLGAVIEEDIILQQKKNSRKAQQRRSLHAILRQNRIRQLHAKKEETASTAPEKIDASTKTLDTSTETEEASTQAIDTDLDTPGSLAQTENNSTEDQPAIATPESLQPNNGKYDRHPSADQPWPEQIRIKLAGMLLSKLMEAAKVMAVKEHPETKELISEEQPAFSKAIIFRKGVKVGKIVANPQLVSMMMREPRPEILVKYLPMIVPPEPWVKFDKGAYLETPTRFIRTRPGEVDQKIYAEAAIARGDLTALFKGLDILGQTPWKINQQVLRVMLTAWNTGDAIANIPPADPDIPLPPEPNKNAGIEEQTKWFREVRRIENEKQGMKSNRCFMNYQLEIARTFRKHILYFPHNLDFRGRAYPIPPLLNHMGADHARSLMLFGTGKKLGKTGLKWLKVHLANLYGFDKASLQEREQFATDNMENVMNSAKNPLDGKRWWLQGEDPWQVLACCFELQAVMESPNPEEYISHFPVHQDGTCNGLQHYAALGGDEFGARQVNLEPAERPADVYSAVADLVRKRIEKDAEKGHRLARHLTDKIQRKVVKQTVMTNVYGVTFIGARAQVCGQLEDLYPNLQQETQEKYIVIAGYIATCIFDALGAMFTGARAIQLWLGESASRVCRSLGADQLEKLSTFPHDRLQGTKSKIVIPPDVKGRLRSTIVWTTPLRLPVAQPYRESGFKKIRTCLQNLQVPNIHRSNPVNRRKQLQGFPPNFVHSLDATHMLLSAIGCDEAGLSFAAVHDSFWTHAADVDKMSAILRDAFVRIHQEDVIGRLRTEFEARYNNSLWLTRVDPSSDAGRAIDMWRASNKYTLLGESILEYKRRNLLSSRDLEEVEQGKKMVTPASIIENHGGIEKCSADHTIDPDEIEEHDDSLAVAEEVDIDDEVEDSLVLNLGPEDDVEAMSSAKMLDVELDEATGTLAPSNDNSESTSATTKNSNKKKSTPFFVWVPLKFPKAPEKGDFDVRRLLNSRYFFS